MEVIRDIFHSSVKPSDHVYDYYFYFYIMMHFRFFSSHGPEPSLVFASFSACCTFSMLFTKSGCGVPM